MDNVLWSDWGRPERILETLQAVGIQPTFPAEIFRAPQTPATVPAAFEVA
ncbi:MAG: hypothetical protein R3B74_01690 [Nitrospirales bacterium]|nr:hypothetical protein [Nitrospirales bacterium]